MDKSNSQGKTFPDAVPLHGNPGQSSSAAAYYTDDDAPEINIDDLPPSYSDAVDLTEAAPMLAPSSVTSGHVQLLDFDAKVVTNEATGAQSWVAKSIEDPVHLEKCIDKLSEIPPRPYITLVGTHSESTRDSKGKPDKNTVTDFDVTVDLTPYLYADAQRRTAWTKLHTVDDCEKVRRGTVLRKRVQADRNLEIGANAKPTLQEWCHRFAASPASLKCFTLERKMVGFDEADVRQRLVDLVRRTNYRGHLQISFVTKDARIDIYNDAKINRWRLTGWIQWLFILTLMIVFSWPYLFFRTKRWEVVNVEWHFSRLDASGRKEYVSLNEDQWYNLWGQAIYQAVLERRQTVLDQSDIRRAHEGQLAIRTGNIQVDASVGLFTASIHAMNEVNRQLGWGGDC
ncbi:hypothetical protein F4861DRAFT_380376 [Xylaria intraflava]|nr:hypothetical protein F4861DRAFT_380376 [Xylaria intraflava]